MSKKSIQIDPELFNISTKRTGKKSKKTALEKEKKKEMLMKVSNKSVKDILLAKLKEYKKKKKNTMKNSINEQGIQNNRINEDFLQILR